MKSYFCSRSCFSSSSKARVDDNTRGIQNLHNVHAFSYDELKVATNGFRSSNKIGKGGFGSVYKGKLEDGRTVAVKVLSVESKQGDREFMSEIASISSIRHENLVNLHGGCVHGASRILVYEYMPNSDLYQTMLGGEGSRAKFGWKARSEICLGIARGLAYIHEEVRPHVVHRDIKASNILLDHNFTPKLSDFGLSKLFSENITHISTRVAGTLGYLAPEYAVTGHLTRKSDIYSFGVLLLEIVSGRSVVEFDQKFGEHYLVEKAWEMYKENRLLELVDPLLNGDFQENDAIRFLKVGLLCVQEKCKLRPYMSTAIKVMRDEISICDMEISQPGLISSIMDLKIGGRTSLQSITRSAPPSPMLWPF